jgi:hypothetical protein
MHGPNRTRGEEGAVKISAVHSKLDSEETDPRYHTDSECPIYRELVEDDNVQSGTGDHWLCPWCAAHW